MKKVSLDTWIQLLGMLGVLGGLVFVGLEMQQSQTIAVAGQIQARNRGDMDFSIALLTAEEKLSRDVNEMGNIALLDPSTLLPDEQAARNLILRWQTVSLQNAWQQYELGLIPEDVWGQAQNRVLSRMESCYTRAAFLSPVIPSFKAYLGSLSVEDCED